MPFTTQEAQVTIKYGDSSVTATANVNDVIAKAKQLAKENGIANFNLKAGNSEISDETSLKEALENGASNLELVPVQKGA